MLSSLVLVVNFFACFLIFHFTAFFSCFAFFFLFSGWLVDDQHKSLPATVGNLTRAMQKMTEDIQGMTENLQKMQKYSVNIQSVEGKVQNLVICRNESQRSLYHVSSMLSCMLYFMPYSSLALIVANFLIL